MEIKEITNADTVLVLRTCDADLRSYGGFQWPDSGHVAAPDWINNTECGNGLHGLLWGEGDASHLDFGPDARGLVVRVESAFIVDLDGKVKFPRGFVEFCGDLRSAANYIVANGGFGRAVVSGTATAGDRGTATAGDRSTATAGDRSTATAGYGGTATAGDRGTATAGDRGTATAGDRSTATAGYGGTATAGDRGTATAGDRGTATAGDRSTATAGYGGTATAGDRGTATAGDRGTATAGDSGTATAGYGGVVAIQYWNGKRYKAKIGHVKDEDGDGELEPNIPYRLNELGEFEQAKPAASEAE